jgi:hypothetical protein
VEPMHGPVATTIAQAGGSGSLLAVCEVCPLQPAIALNRTPIATAGRVHTALGRTIRT